MRKRTPPSNEGYSSSSSTSPTTRQRAFEHQRSSSRTRTRPRPRDGEPSVLGSVGTLVRLALLALVLAWVVPYMRTYLFGGSAARNATSVDVKAGKNPYHHQAQQPVYDVVRNGGGDEGKAEVDVFNFSHQDYLAAAGRTEKRKAVASASRSAVVASTPSKRTPKQQRKKPATRTRSTDDEDDDNDYDNTQHTSPSTSILSLAITLLSHLYALVATALRFASIPFVHLLRLTLALTAKCYHAMRFSLSHTLRPIVHLLAPLTYLVSGILFVFVQTPLRVLTAVATELYPVYIFLGAATVVGIGMGVLSAGVMYLSAFIFVDRLPTQSVKDERRMVEEEEEEVEVPLSNASSRGSYQAFSQQGYFQPHPQSVYASSPLVSPTTPYRPATRGDARKAYPAYSTVPGSSLRASVH
ncbi:uncharacterized protein SRS1_15819 [Sporisorium reilianum f. sp. reilianum]|uniref:Uncharacterized protein n=1 Tax=Sporisorium reilianum f. sp. reilianum TaxID=72559 RepID=A0A2N8UJU6_9BASI|nr:uncharacterized protein SRS1_15819 [Sporisorium reilianum f. sp. reilianum]